MLLTVEGERDDICAVGQTVAAHDLCTGLRPYRKRHHMQAGLGHYGVFSGKRWTSQIYPIVKNGKGASEAAPARLIGTQAYRGEPRHAGRKWPLSCSLFELLNMARRRKSVDVTVSTIAAEPEPLAVNTGRTALLIIDMQRDFLQPGGFGAALGNHMTGLKNGGGDEPGDPAAERSASMLIIHTREGHWPDLTDVPIKVERGDPPCASGCHNRWGLSPYAASPGIHHP